VTGTVQGRSIADAAFDPFLAELDRRGALLYVHPAGLGADSPHLRGGLTWPVGAPVEATVAAAQLIAAGVPSRFPRLRILVSHLGGALPMLLPRMDRQFSWAVPDAPETLGADRLALGTDFPYQRDEAYVEAVDLVGEALGDATAEPILAAEGLGLDIARARAA
jgi:hypothetical protein